MDDARAAADRPEPADVVGVVLTGGTGARLGGVDKALLVAGGRRLLDRSLAALAQSDLIVVVGPEVEVPRIQVPAIQVPQIQVRGAADVGCPVVLVRERPAGGGPAAGLLAALDAALDRPGPTPQWLAVLAVDMPWVTGPTLARLRGAAGAAAGLDGAVLVDADGRRQLCVVVRVDALRAVRPQEPAGLGFFRLLGGLDLVDVRAVGREAVDVDTPADLAALHGTRPLAEGPGSGEAGPVNPLDAWLQELTDALGPDASLTPDGTGAQIDTHELLDLTRVVAHDVVRPAAPLTLFVLGLVAGRTQAGPQEVSALVAQVEALVGSRTRGADAEGADD